MVRVYNKHHGDAPKEAVYIGRGSPWGNPFSHLPNTKALYQVGSRDEACDRFEKEVLPSLDVEPLRGKDLLCFCAPLRCHGDSILKKLYGEN